MSPVANLSGWRFKTVGVAGGANIRDALNFVAQDQMRPSENVILSERGGGRKRLGCMSHGTFGTAAARVLSTYTYYRAGAGPQVIIHTNEGNLYYTDDPSANPTVWTLMAGGVDGTVPFSYETFGGKVYMCNGVDNYMAWNGATLSFFPSAPKGRYLRLWKETMWIAGVTGMPDRVYTSTEGDPETFPVDGFIDLSKGDGDMIRALATDGQFLIVGKRDSTLAMYDPVTFANRVVDFEKGFESHFAVASYEGGIYFLSRDRKSVV